MTELRQRNPRECSDRHLDFIRSQPCCIPGCGKKSEAAHIRTGSLAHEKRDTGGGEKSSDRWALPLCRDHHAEQHDTGSEIAFWKKYGIDCFVLAARFWGLSVAAGTAVLSKPRKTPFKKAKQAVTNFGAGRSSFPKRAFPKTKSSWAKRTFT